MIVSERCPSSRPKDRPTPSRLSLPTSSTFLASRGAGGGLVSPGSAALSPGMRLIWPSYLS